MDPLPPPALPPVPAPPPNVPRPPLPPVPPGPGGPGGLGVPAEPSGPVTLGTAEDATAPTVDLPTTAAAPVAPAAPVRATLGFMLRHPARWVALGMGSGLSPWAPGTVGTLWAWASYLLLRPWFSDAGFGLLLLAAAALGWWACTRTAQHLRQSDPSAVVWDEVLAFWLVLWLVTPASFWTQALAFGLFRYFDAAKPGPVGWADRRYKAAPGQPPSWRSGYGILLDDLIAAGCTLMVMALLKTLSG